MFAGLDDFCGTLPYAAKVELYKQGEWCSPVELFDTEAKFEVGAFRLFMLGRTSRAFFTQEL